MTYRELYEEGISRLSGMPDAKVDARIFLEEVCGKGIQVLLLSGDDPALEEEEKLYLSYIERRIKREPTAMILGRWWFMGLEFELNKDTLIPEQDTECLAELAIEEVNRLKAGRILDLCTGSGCILISILKLCSKALNIEGVGTDISEGALAAAVENGRKNEVSDRITWLLGDMFEALEKLPESERCFDVIVSNPPYIPTDVIEGLEPEVKDGEPYRALWGGDDGLVFYRLIAGKVGSFLAPGGSILIETGFDQARAVKELFKDNGYEDIEIFNDLGGLERGLIIRKRR